MRIGLRGEWQAVGRQRSEFNHDCQRWKTKANWFIPQVYAWSHHLTTTR
jgi:hypothetical protein